MNRRFFEDKIQPVLQYVGIIGASICAVAYILIVSVMIVGFSYHQSRGAIAFAIVNSAVGIIIMQFLKIQGISFAENDPENKQIVDLYFGTKTKDKKPHSLSYFWLTTCLKDVTTKGISMALTTFGLIYIVIEGSKDYNMLLMAVVNLLLFTCFGLLSLSKAYKYYYHSYIPYIKEKIKEKEHDNN